VTRGSTVARVALAAAVVGVLYVQYAPARAVPAALRLRPLPARYPTAAPPADSELAETIRRLGSPVLELPVGRGRVPFNALFHARAMYRAIFHGQPLVNGYHGYWPATFPARMALAGRLPDAEALAALWRETGVGTIVVHPSDFGAEVKLLCRGIDPRAPGCELADPGADDRGRWRAVVEHGDREDLRLVGRYGEALVFRVVAPALWTAPEGGGR
jgi:hypothetical protein